MPASLQVKTAAELEAEQEEMLRKKYGGLQPKKKLLPKVRPLLLSSLPV